MKTEYIGKAWYEKEIRQAVPLLSYPGPKEFKNWKAQVRVKIQELLGDMPEPSQTRATDIAYSKESSFQKITFVIETENDSFPCMLILPLWADRTTPAPVIACLQGHETGMHLSLGITKNETDEKLLQDNMDFAIQAVEHGFAALLVEMRFMGTRRFDASQPCNVISCYRPEMAALLLGKTAIGLRVADLRAVIYALPQFAHFGIRISPLICLGHSGGGTATFFTGCLEDKIDAVVISCALCNFEYSILQTEHCSCNYVPGLMKYFNMSDMAAAIFPRPIISLGGAKDDLFLIEGTESTLNKIDRMYRENGVSGQCVFLRGEGGHVFFKEKAWPEIVRLYKNLIGQRGRQENREISDEEANKK